jgi:hypothetical protein
MTARKTRIVPQKHWSLCVAPLALALVACGANVAPLVDGGTDRGTVGPDVASQDVRIPPPSDGGAACTVPALSSFRVPSLLFAGQPLGLTAVAGGQGCGCSMSLRLASTSPFMSYQPELCGCCTECECVDGSYTASVLLGAPSQSTRITAGVFTVRTVHVSESPDRCESTFIRVSGVRIYAPEGRVTGPALHWAEVYGTHRYCCDAAVGFVERRAGNTITLEPRSCQTVGCAMACPPIDARPDAPFSSSHLLGELTNGDYQLSVAGTTVTFTVRR